MTATRRTAQIRTPALAACVAAVLLVAGCRGTPSRSPSAGAPEEVMGVPEITAEGHFAAGQFHESAIITGSDGRPQPGQIRNARRNAIRQYEHALGVDPNHRDSLFRLAVLATEDRDVARAADFWTRYVTATGGSAVAWRNMAVSFDLLGESARAEGAYRSALAADPDDAISRVNLGMLLARASRLPEARDQLSRVLPPAGVHYHVAQALQRRGEHAAAAAELRAAGAIDARYQSASLSVLPME